MATPAVIDYQDAAHLLLRQAHEELQAGDLRQASEKGWGAAAEIVKAVAEGRGRNHYAHHLLIRVAADLAAETGDSELYDLFSNAQSLHTNFYENWLPRDFVAHHIARVEQFIARVEPLITD